MVWKYFFGTTNDPFFAKLTATKYDINIEENSMLGVGGSATVYKSQMIIDGNRQTVRFATECFIFPGGHKTVQRAVKIT